jgi:transposase
MSAVGDCVWVVNADHVKRWAAEHQRKASRWSADQKASDHLPVFQSRREADALKYRNRMNSACHQAAAQVVAYAVQKRFGVLNYNDTNHAFCSRFPWYALRQMIVEKCNNHGIKFELVDSIGERKESD